MLVRKHITLTALGRIYIVEGECWNSSRNNKDIYIPNKKPQSLIPDIGQCCQQTQKQQKGSVLKESDSRMTVLSHKRPNIIFICAFGSHYLKKHVILLFAVLQLLKLPKYFTYAGVSTRIIRECLTPLLKPD